LVTDDGVEHIISYSLQDLEKKLDPEVFLRIHRSSIVSMSKVKEIKSLGSSRFNIIMKDGTEIETSRSYCEKIREVLLGKRDK
jgi:two-component system LytT family response regulator